MWYFAWILGLGLAASFSVLNAMWYEVRDRDAHPHAQPGHDPVHSPQHPH